MAEARVLHYRKLIEKLKSFGRTRHSVFCVVGLTYVDSLNCNSGRTRYPFGTLETRERVAMRVQGIHWLDYDPVALAVLLIGLSIVELLVLSA